MGSGRWGGIEGDKGCLLEVGEEGADACVGPDRSIRYKLAVLSEKVEFLERRVEYVERTMSSASA